MSDFDEWMFFMMLRNIKIPRSLGCGIIIGAILFLILCWVLAKLTGH